MQRHLHKLLRVPHPRFALRGGPLVPPWLGGLLAEAEVVSPHQRGGDPSFRRTGGPAQTREQAELKNTCGCSRCVEHYERCIQSVMAQVQDLGAQNLELQRSQQELSQAVASTAALRAHLDQVLHTVVLPGLTRLNSEGARLNR